jgi:hypothetical protein
MTRTANLGLPLVQAAQAQKHVTVNEAFGILDATAQLTIESLTTAAPPLVGTEGMVFGIPPGASGEWAGDVGRLAVFSNGGWIFVSPQRGWRGWNVEAGVPVLFDGSVWHAEAVTASFNGAASLFEVREIDVTLTAGTSVTTVDVIPAPCVVFGISGIVNGAIAGDLASWRLGVPGGSDRYGSGLGVELGSWVQGVSGQPQAYYAPTPLVLEAEGGAFSGGQVRLAVHLFRMTIPRV